MCCCVFKLMVLLGMAIILTILGMAVMMVLMTRYLLNSMKFLLHKTAKSTTATAFPDETQNVARTEAYDVQLMEMGVQTEQYEPMYVPPMVPRAASERRAPLQQVYVAGAECWHTNPDCAGLRRANRVSTYRACRLCAQGVLN